MNGSEEIEELLSILYHALRTSRRRHTIQIMKETQQNTASTRELARDIVSQEENISKKNATGEPYHNVYNALSQTHLPTLSDARVIIYDSQRQTIKKDVNFETAVLLMETNCPIVSMISSVTENNRDEMCDNHHNHSKNK